MTALATATISILLLNFGENLYRLFSNDEEVIRQGMIILKLLVPTYMTYICVEVLSGAVRGAGDSVVPTLFTLCGICLLRVVWVKFVTPSHNDIDFMLLSYPITWTITSLLFVVYYLRGNWLKRCIKKAGFPEDVRA